MASFTTVAPPKFVGSNFSFGCDVTVGASRREKMLRPQVLKQMSLLVQEFYQEVYEELRVGHFVVVIVFKNEQSYWDLECDGDIFYEYPAPLYDRIYDATNRICRLLEI
jgi:hypothetical protein